jgi:uncharacterized membrane protein YedE/YeeE
MNWTDFTPIPSLIGGVLIGLATGLTLLLNGKIAGISGVVARILRPTHGDALWRAWFIAGLIAGGALTFALYPPSANLDFSHTSVWWMAVAGLLVGVGTRLGGGCTSGHGVCGISRGSTGGVVATVVFMIVAGIVVFVRSQLTGGAS